MCRWSIGEKFYREAIAAADFSIVAICRTGKYSGIKACVIARRQEPGGIYISLVCNSEMFTPTGAKFGLRIGQILQVALLNYARTLGITHAYNHASSEDLVPFYTRNGWRMSKAPCGLSDSITEEASQLRGAVGVSLRGKYICITNYETCKFALFNTETESYVCQAEVSDRLGLDPCLLTDDGKYVIVPTEGAINRVRVTE